MSGRTRGGKSLRQPFTAIPDSTLEALARAPVMTARRLRVSLVLARWSFGFLRDWVYVSPRGLGLATGLEAKKAAEALRELVRARVVLERPMNGRPAYALNAAAMEWLDEVPAPGVEPPSPQAEMPLAPVDKSPADRANLAPEGPEWPFDRANLARHKERETDLERDISERQAAPAVDNFRAGSPAHPSDLDAVSVRPAIEAWAERLRASREDQP